MQIKKKNNSYKLCQYIEQGKPYLACIKNSDKEKTTILNSLNKELTISSNRIEFLPGRIPNQFSHSNQIIAYLKGLTIESNNLKKHVNIESLWEQFKKNKNDIKLEQIQKSIFKSTNIANYLGVKWALFDDKYFFKKTKLGYQTRKGDSVEEIKKLVEAEQKKKEEIANWVQQIRNKEQLDSDCIKILEKTSALGSKYELSNIAEKILAQVISDFKIHSNKKIQDKAFDLLVQLELFSKHQNLTPIKLDRRLYFSQKDLENAQSIAELDITELDTSQKRVDFTKLMSFTIDGIDTNDYDDALSLEITEQEYIARIHISDVSSLIKPESELWNLAKNRGASIYTADSYYPMLPHVLSEKHFSLVKDQIRQAITISVKFTKDFEEKEFDIQKSLIKVNNRLSYEEVDTQLEENRASDEINILLRIAEKLEAQRVSNGAKILPKREMSPIINAEGIVSIEKTNEDTPSRKLISEMMICANNKSALFCKDNKIPIYYRQQEKPGEVDLIKIPEGPALEYAKRGTMKRSTFNTHPGPHSGLGLECYAQCSSPIRRFSDLVNQNQISCFLDKAPMLSLSKLDSDSDKIESVISEVIYIQRNRHKYWLLEYLRQQKTVFINGTIIKSENNRSLAELSGLIFFAQFKKLKDSNLKIGQEIKLKIEQIRPKYNFLKVTQIND